ncbi:hypothetical protein NrS5_32 [Nitratiruptor phage NrS-5]|uniref:hypothetical protein n=1 Tax=unclassified Nitratiruptor TaxID=2624044 RepID=UPI001914FE9B|nr:MULTISPECIES: hypothetical protein [unclassified Nitratiruptor]BCD61736.1 hypothetical protein NitYY0813_C0596 [Nitratiruptor sp. YY08-13]BCD65671.1 hypothetical protein NitYY0826_C0598 [Nitratiruptor sp. YY08-26]BCD83214.1 hypothetical protein NrS4_32 [Nitratiruptor phage NrS-4]BCD83273.1 hypothetical protein NrS5_32 [Nitratiruptor phage NrS-5]
MKILVDRNKIYINTKTFAILKGITQRTVQRYIKSGEIDSIELKGGNWIELKKACEWEKHKIEQDGEEELDIKLEDAKLKKARREKIEKELAILNKQHRPIDELDEAQANFIKTFISIIDAKTYDLDENNRLKVQRWIASAIDKAREVFEQYA